MEKRDLYTRLKEKKVIVVTHVYGTGASQDLKRYFVDHGTGETLFIGHPLFYSPRILGSGIEVYENGIKKSERYCKNYPIPLFLGYFIHLVKTLLWVLGTKDVWDIYVGSNNVNAFAGIVLKKLGRVKKVVYYVFDFNPRRFDNPLVNRMYQWLDQYCVRHSDETWNMSPRMEEGRKKYFGFRGGNQLVVPVGLWLHESESLPLSKIRRHSLAFVGHVQKKQGIQHVVEAMPNIIKRISDFTFVVIGGGDYVEPLRKRATSLGVSKHITFTGFVKDHRDIDKLLSTCAVGVALYDRYEGKKISFSYFGNPTKIKTYFAAGLPVLISDVPYNAREIERERCGKVVSYDPDKFAQAVVSMLQSDSVLADYRSHVVAYRKRFDWNAIFTKQLSSLV